MEPSFLSLDSNFEQQTYPVELGTTDGSIQKHILHTNEPNGNLQSYIETSQDSFPSNIPDPMQSESMSSNIHLNNSQTVHMNSNIGTLNVDVLSSHYSQIDPNTSQMDPRDSGMDPFISRTQHTSHANLFTSQISTHNSLATNNSQRDTFTHNNVNSLKFKRLSTVTSSYTTSSNSQMSSYPLQIDLNNSRLGPLNSQSDPVNLNSQIDPNSPRDPLKVEPMDLEENEKNVNLSEEMPTMNTALVTAGQDHDYGTASNKTSDHNYVKLKNEPNEATVAIKKQAPKRKAAKKIITLSLPKVESNIELPPKAKRIKLPIPMDMIPKSKKIYMVVKKINSNEVIEPTPYEKPKIITVLPTKSLMPIKLENPKKVKQERKTRKTKKEKKLTKKQLKEEKKLKKEQKAKKGAFACTSCCFSTSNKKEFDKHNSTQHMHKNCSLCLCKTDEDQNGFVKCDYCNYTTKNLQALKSHMVIHTKNKSAYKCSSCNFNAVNIKDLIDHSKTAHKLKTKTLKHSCDKCNFTTNYEQRFITHQMLHSDEKPEVCVICEKCFRDARTLKRHISKNHGKAIALDVLPSEQLVTGISFGNPF